MNAQATILKQKRWRLLKAVIFVLLLFMGFQYYLDFDADLSLLNLDFTVLKMMIFFVNYLWLYPKLFRKKQYLKWAIGILLLLLFGLALRYTVEEIIYPAYLGFRNYHEGTTLIYYAKDGFFFLSPWIIFSTVFGLVEDWTKMKNDKQALEQQNTQAELALLKSQLNPHFLFNTLNSIYSLAYQKSDKAPDAILKLSEVMRYMLYDSEDKVVLLEKELQYLHSFVDLQKARFKENIYVDLLVEGPVTNQLIMPVLLIAFVENAFKHGVLSDPSDPVLIHVIVEGNHLQLNVQNKINHQLKDQTGGIGLPNIRRRLELLYPGRHTLNIKENDTHYICELSLQL
ncbi:histidine kinase [Chitinophaga niabensis]|uniref:sensor histidine kinase n=1 Tax=Chitinophaga niabensis TaxID=536979 RepID=UPI0031BB667F